MKRIIILLLSVVVWGVAQSQTAEPALRKVYVSSELGYPLAPASSADGTFHTGVLSAGSVDINTLLPQYKMGGVPTQRIWNDKDFFGFYVSTDTLNLSSATLSYTVDGFPEDRISFNPQTGKFLFYPDSTDIAGFTLRLTADAGDDYIISQDVQFGVEPQKGNMFSYLSDESRAMPNPDDYFRITKIKEGKQVLNGDLRDSVMLYSIAGINVTLNVNDEANKLKDLYTMKNLKELNIYAERVIIESPVNFLSTNITIYADEIIFRNGACLRTTPVNAASAKELSSGDVNLYARKLTNETAGALFYMIGKFTSNLSGVAHTSVIAEEHVNQPYIWLHPNWLLPVVSMLGDAFIDQQNKFVEASCDYYISKIEEYKSSTHWSNDIESLELESIVAEMKSMNSKIKQNFDYFGNPQGFMPMLSFQVNKDLYEKEIDRSIKTMYFAYWMKNAEKTIEQQIAACQEALKQEKEQLAENLSLAQSLQSSSMNLQSSMINLIAEMDTLTEKLDRKTNELLWIAKDNVAKYNQLNRAKKIVGPLIKVVGIVGGAAIGAKLIKVEDPEKTSEKVKKAGETGSMIADKIFDLINPPLDQTYAGDPPYAEFYNTLKSDAANFEGSVSSFSTTLKNVNKDALGSREGVLQVGGDLRNSSASMLATINKFDKAIAKTSVSNEEIQTELNKLIAESPEYSELAEQVTALNLKKENTVLEMYSVFNQLLNTTYEIQRGIVTIDALNVENFEASLKRDTKTMLFVDNMDRNARRRLLESHYYMARSYEYTFLEAYKISLNTGTLFEKCKKIVENATGSNLSESDFNTLKQVYKEDLATIDSKIIGAFQSNSISTEQKIAYTFKAEQLDALNSGASTISINLFEDGKFQLTETDLRLLDINITSLEFDVTGDIIDVDSYFDLAMVHEGNSRFIKNGKVLGFVHKNNAQPIKWEFRCFQNKNKNINKTEPAKASIALLNTLLSNSVTSNTVFAKPAAWSNISFKRTNSYNKEAMDINVKKLELEITYQTINDNNTYPVAYVTTDKGLNPNIQLTVNNVPTAMVNGFYAQVFRNKQSTLQLKAPERFGEWQFDKWVSQSNEELSANSTYNAGTISESKYIKATYKKIPAVLNVETTFEIPKEKGYLQIRVENTGSQTLEWKTASNEPQAQAPSAQAPWRAPIAEEPQWLDIKAGKSGLNNGYITVGLDENSTEQNRTRTIKILSNAGEKEILITQRGDIPTNLSDGAGTEKDHITIYMRENGLCYVDLGREATFVNAEVYDMNGQAVKRISAQHTRILDVDMSALSGGTYIINITCDEKEHSQKVVKY